MDGEDDRSGGAAAAAAAAPTPAAGRAAVLAMPALDPTLPVFAQGSILRHVLVMTGTATIGIMAIFVVDLLSLLYVARLGETTLTAAVGFATQVMFYPTSINIGLTIGATALVARALGAADLPLARRLATAGLVYAAAISFVIAATALLLLDPILALLGAQGEVAAVARRFLLIVLPANVPLAMGMVLSGVLRAAGDARRAMYVTLAGGIVTGLIDPILIFGLHFGVYGAAISTVVSRFVFLGVGLWGVARVHDLLGRASRLSLVADFTPVFGIALPAVATNLATPVSNSYVLHVFARFGSEAIAATAVTDRLVPVAFSVLFALSGAVGPILAQNLGARRYDRVVGTLTTSFLFVAVYVLAIWAVLWAAAPFILWAFGISGRAGDYITFFCRGGVAAWLFIGVLFVANASFNNLGFAWLSLLFNWGRASLGAIPFVTLGATYGGVIGGQIGLALGAAVFGSAALLTAYRVVGRLAKSADPP